MDKYKYAIQLLFDEKTENCIKEIIDTFRAKKLVNETLIKKNYRPHLTLAVFKSIDRDFCLNVLNNTSQNCTSFPVSFSGFGLFNSDIKALYLNPVFTEDLRNIHSYVLEQFRGRNEQNWAIYDKDSWVPHCGILMDYKNRNIFEALKYVEDVRVETGLFDKIQLTGLKESPIYNLKKC